MNNSTSESRNANQSENVFQYVYSTKNAYAEFFDILQINK